MVFSSACNQLRNIIHFSILFATLLFYCKCQILIFGPAETNKKASPDILGRLYQWGSDVNFNGAGDENRTRTGCPTRPSNVRVYHFHHPGTRDLEIIRSISSFVKSLFEKIELHFVPFQWSTIKLSLCPVRVRNKKNRRRSDASPKKNRSPYLLYSRRSLIRAAFPLSLRR